MSDKALKEGKREGCSGRREKGQSRGKLGRNGDEMRGKNISTEREGCGYVTANVKLDETLI